VTSSPAGIALRLGLHEQLRDGPHGDTDGDAERGLGVCRLGAVDCSGAVAQHLVTMSAAKDLHGDLQHRAAGQLKVNITGTGSGTVTIAPPGN